MLKNKMVNVVKKATDGMKNLMKAFFSVNISRNTGIKLFSLILAILFWIYVMDQVDPEITKVYESIPVQFINMQELDQNNLKIMNQHDYLVNVEVTGRRNNILNLNSKSIYLWADMRGVRAGTNTIPINRTINAEAISIKSITPGDIVLQVDQIVSLPKPVKILTTGNYQSSLFLDKITTIPEEIKVTGPTSIVNTVSYLGGTLNVTSLTADITKDVSLIPYNFQGEIVNGVTIDSSYANVSVFLAKTKNVELKVEVEGTVKEGFEIVSINVIPAFVSVSGKIEAIDLINTISVEKITLSGDEDSTFIIEKDIVLPEGISATGIEGPAQVEIQIEEIQTKEFTYELKDLAIINLQEDLKADLSSNNEVIKVKIKGVESVIEKIAKTDIGLSLVFTNVEREGVYRLKVVPSEYEKLKEIVIEPVYVEVTVTEKQ